MRKEFVLSRREGEKGKKKKETEGLVYRGS